MKRMTVLQYLSRLLCLAVIVSMTACGDDDDDDDDEPGNPILGVYVFKSATFKEETTIIVPVVDENTGEVTGKEEQTFPVGAPGTSFVSEGIVGNAPCTDSANAAIELREDGTSFYVCIGEDNEEKQGTWEITVDASDGGEVFTLNIIDPQFQVRMKPFSLEGTKLSGTASIPLPKDATEPTSQTNLQEAEMEIEFTKQP